jgi:hypothetical protein
MAQTVIRGTQILNNTVQRQDLDVSTVGQAVATKIVQGSGIALSSTGADSGTGDVTISTAATFITKSAAYTLTLSDSGKYVICSGGSWALTLPVPVVGLTYQVRNDMGISGTVGTITLSPTGGTIDGLASIPLLPSQECTIVTDGANWRTFGKQREVILGTQDITSSTASGVVLLPVGYRYFELQFTNLAPVTAGDYVAGQLSANGGSTWLATAYYHGVISNSSSTVVGYANTENGGGFFICPHITNNSFGISKLTLMPGTASLFPNWKFESGSRNNSNYQETWSGNGALATAGVINALKYTCSTGNILNSQLTVKGVV